MTTKAYQMTTAAGNVLALDLHELRDAMQRRGFAFSELGEHVSDIESGHTVWAEDGTYFTLTYRPLFTQHPEFPKVRTNHLHASVLNAYRGSVVADAERDNVRQVSLTFPDLRKALAWASDEVTDRYDIVVIGTGRIDAPTTVTVTDVYPTLSEVR